MRISQQNKSAAANEKSLPGRLSTIASLVPEGALLCDVGSDHAALPIELFRMGRIDRAIITDVHQNPLDRAKKAVEEAGFADRSSFYLADGILPLLHLLPDVFVIAGMSGETIAAILGAAKEKIEKNTLFLLQPMTKIPFLRSFLARVGFSVEAEKAAVDHKKAFLVFCVRYVGKSRILSEEAAIFGDFLPKDSSFAAKAFLKKERIALEKVLEGKRKAGYDISFEEKILQRFKTFPEV